MTKPLLIPLLLGFYLVSATEPNYLIILALVLGWLGDVFLLGSKTHWFLMGLLAFLGGHIMYSLAFAQNLPAVEVFPAVAAGAVYLFMGLLGYRSLLRPGMGTLRLPVLLYILALISMSWLAALNWYSNPISGNTVILIGTWFFCLSDYLLGRRLVKPTEHLSHLAVMLTYLLAQLLIIIGLVI